MAFYRDDTRIAPQPSQFGSIDLSGINLNLIQGMSDDDFLDEYAYAITAYDLTSDLSQATGNQADLKFHRQDSMKIFQEILLSQP